MMDNLSDGDRRRTRRALVGAPLGAAAFLVVIVAMLTERQEVAGWAFLAAGVVCVAFGAPIGIRYWRGLSPESRRLEPSARWPYSRALWLGNLRATPVMAWSGMVFFVLVGVILLGQTRGTLLGVDLSGPAPARLGATLLVVMMGLAGSIVAFNRPKALVPPHLRDHDGWITMLIEGSAHRDHGDERDVS